MYSKITTVINKTGLHARPASDFVRLAGSFDAEIFIRKTDSDKKSNAKSIIMVLSLALRQGTQIEISAQGPEKVQAVDALVTLLEEGFPDSE